MHLNILTGFIFLWNNNNSFPALIINAVQMKPKATHDNF